MNYQIYGEPMPVVICNVDPGESLISESGAMSWMTPNMQMQTSGGGAGKMFGRMFSGESLFQNIYTAQNGPGMIAFASSFPGSIRAFEITPDHPIVCQKKSFLASTSGVELSVQFQKKLAPVCLAAKALSCSASPVRASPSSRSTAPPWSTTWPPASSS